MVSQCKSDKAPRGSSDRLRNGAWVHVAFDREHNAESWKRAVYLDPSDHGTVWRRATAPVAAPGPSPTAGPVRPGGARRRKTDCSDSGSEPARAALRQPGTGGRAGVAQNGREQQPGRTPAHIRWTKEADSRLLELVESTGIGNWRHKAELLPLNSTAPTPEQVEKRWQTLFKKAMLAHFPHGDRMKIQHADGSFDAIVRHTDSLAWIHFVGCSATKDQFVSKSNLLERAPAEWASVDRIACKLCGSQADADSMLLCDACSAGYHIGCLGLSAIPKSEKWFCSQRRCQREGAAKVKHLNAKLGSSLNTKHPIENGQVVEYQFLDQDDRASWYPGLVVRVCPGWAGWFDVEFEDSTRRYSLQLNDDNYGSAWRKSTRWSQGWTQEMDAKLHALVKKHGCAGTDWQAKADQIGDVHRVQVMWRWQRVLSPQLADRCEVCNGSKGKLLSCAGCKGLMHADCCVHKLDAEQGKSTPSILLWYCDKPLCQRKLAPRKRKRPENALTYQDTYYRTSRSKHTVPSQAAEDAGCSDDGVAHEVSPPVNLWDSIDYAFTEPSSGDLKWYRGVVVELTQWDEWYKVLFDADNSVVCVKITHGNNNSVWRRRQPKPWSKSTTEELICLVKKDGLDNWDEICQQLRTGTPVICRRQWYKAHWQMVLDRTALLRTAGINKMFDARLGARSESTAHGNIGEPTGSMHQRQEAPHETPARKPERKVERKTERDTGRDRTLSEQAFWNVADLSLTSSFFSSESEETRMRKKTPQIRDTECKEIEGWSSTMIPIVPPRPHCLCLSMSLSLSLAPSHIYVYTHPCMFPGAGSENRREKGSRSVCKEDNSTG